VEAVERGKAALVRAVPSPRGEPGPMAEALLGFEQALVEARSRMGAWRSPRTEDVWRACLEALDQAAGRAERLRLEAPALDYESLVTVLGDLIAPLDAFEDADRALSGR
jgi:hypothetical protein